MPTDDKSTSLTYNGTWGAGVSTAAYGGSYHSTKTANAAVATTVYTDQVSVIGTKSTTTGKFAIYVDGSLKATVDTYRATAAARQTLATVTVPFGRHAVKVVNLATAGRPNLLLDAIATRR